MIDRDATIAKFGYDPDTLSHGSGKRVVAICEGCGKVRILMKTLYRDRCQSCANKKRSQDHEARKKIGESKKKYFEDPEARKKQSAALKKHYEDPEARKKLSATQKKRFEDPEAHEKLSTAKKKYFKDHPNAGEKHSVWMKKRYEDPKEHMKSSASMKKRYEDPEARKKNSESKKKYFKDHPEAREKLSAARQGVSYADWEAFSKNSPYCPAFNETCRESNREKYGRRCFICDLPESKNITKTGKQKKLSVHHVDMNKNQGCDGHEWKLIPTCLHHHGTTHNPTWIGRITYLLSILP